MVLAWASPAPSACSRPRRAPMSRFLTVEEVAEALGVSVSWVYKHKELLGGVRLGRRLWRFPEQELTTLLAQPARGSPWPVMEDAVGGRSRQISARGSWRLD
jgi:excisionase family DNA binding protein